MVWATRLAPNHSLWLKSVCLFECASMHGGDRVPRRRRKDVRSAHFAETANYALRRARHFEVHEKIAAFYGHRIFGYNDRTDAKSPCDGLTLCTEANDARYRASSDRVLYCVAQAAPFEACGWD